MNKWMLLLAGCSGLVGFILLECYRSDFEKRVSGGDSIVVVVASMDVLAETRLSPEMLTLRELPQAYVDDRHIQGVDKTRIEGLRLLNDVKAGGVLFMSDVVRSRGKSRELSDLIVDGKRASTIVVDNLGSLSDMIRPGDRVDVLYTHSMKGTLRSVPLMQRVLVLAVGTETERELDLDESSETTDVTVSVSSKQAEALVHAKTIGTLSLVLRSAGDSKIDRNKKGTTVADLGIGTNRNVKTSAGNLNIQKGRRIERISSQ